MLDVVLKAADEINSILILTFVFLFNSIQFYLKRQLITASSQHILHVQKEKQPLGQFFVSQKSNIDRAQSTGGIFFYDTTLVPCKNRGSPSASRCFAFSNCSAQETQYPHYPWGIIPNNFVLVLQLKEVKQHLYIRTKEGWNSPM